MNEEQIKTQEYIFRNREAVPQPKKEKKTGIKAIIAAAGSVLVIAALVFILITVINNDKVDAEAKQTADTGIVADNGSAEELPEETADEEKQEEELAKEEPPTPTPEPATPTPEPTKEPEVTEALQLADEFFDEEGEIATGLVSTITDPLDFYRVDDPELPSYLTRKTNEGFKMKLDQTEIDLLVKLVEAEAPAEDIFGKILVANVVLNRVLKEGWADTVTGVIYERYGRAVQFQSTANSYYWNSIKPTDTSKEAVMRALAGEDYSDGAEFFYAWAKHPELSPTKGWISIYTYLFIHGGHAFYK